MDLRQGAKREENVRGYIVFDHHVAQIHALPVRLAITQAARSMTGLLRHGREGRLPVLAANAAIRVFGPREQKWVPAYR